jgi:hypothetical protein
MTTLLSDRQKDRIISGELVVVQSSSASVRRAIHMECESIQTGEGQKLYHVSFNDKQFHQIWETKYKCTTCDRWRHHTSKEVRTQYCCEDDEGLRTCDDYTLFCRICDSIVWYYDAENDGHLRSKTYCRNNAIAISTSVKSLVPILSQLGVKEERAERWMQKREKKAQRRNRTMDERV